MEQQIIGTLNSLDLNGWLIPTVFLVGLLTSLTPCVYPILPITIATFAQRKYTRIAPLLYCLGFALIYAGLGLAAALTGNLFGQVASNPWILLIFANILLYFAAINLGIVSLPALPNQRQQRSTMPFMAGMASALVAAPCTSPVLGALLILVASNQHPLLGAILLFSFALGMSALLLLAGTSTRLLSKLPKSGKWLSYISNFTALTLVAMAQYFLIQAGKSWL
ncbi:cytochrome c biogenesis protein CcdA [Pseudoalteromonas sp. Of7M-16]|uniref:cytochrome c biogenesis protein CcdA n=1 Tax=Pseudoalteromonas sp. Of7M-16 TaxID=2917756 RepID=UPI001EF4CF8D|nr:cytochrome c biogenesis protein CcdA [Pseudoalteromonas sp. Of7M-16]MCG7551117.1 sulfite exporter TauE/SafE family protein [Pseudoalteromonas sp. Of7M-16]